MGVKNINELFRRTRNRKDLSSSDLHLLMLIAHHMNDEKTSCYFCEETALAETKMSRNTLVSVRKRLLAKGLISIQKGGYYEEGKKATVYHLWFRPEPSDTESEDAIPDRVDDGMLKIEQKNVKIEQGNVKIEQKNVKINPLTDITDTTDTTGGVCVNPEDVPEMFPAVFLAREAVARCGDGVDCLAAGEFATIIYGRHYDMVANVIEKFEIGKLKFPVGVLKKRIREVPMYAENDGIANVPGELWSKLNAEFDARFPAGKEEA